MWSCTNMPFVYIFGVILGTGIFLLALVLKCADCLHKSSQMTKEYFLLMFCIYACIM
jgi:hypothetical protein